MFYRITHLTAKLSLYLLLFSTLVMACAKLPIAKSYWENSNNPASSYSGFDQKSNIRWTIGNDAKNLYLYLDTDNRGTKRTILMRGLTIYLDPTGGKHKSIYFEYPYRGGFNHAFVAMNRNNFAPSENGMTPDRNRSFKSPTRAYWKNGDDGMVLNTAMEHSNFKYSIQLDTLGYLNYKVTIPLNEIESHGFTNIKDLSVGIQVASRPESQFNGRSGGDFRGHFGDEGGDRGGFGGRGGFGDDGGGRRGFGGDRGNFGGARREGGERRSNFTPVNIKIWFQTYLAKSS